MRNFVFRQILQSVIATNDVRLGQASACRAFTEELLGHSVERVHFKLDVRRRAQKHQFHWLLQNRTFRGKYRASEKVASQRADF